jgi:hypothetical protein
MQTLPEALRTLFPLRVRRLPSTSAIVMLVSTLSSTVLTVVRVFSFELCLEVIEAILKGLDGLGGDVHVVSIREWLERFIPLLGYR